MQTFLDTIKSQAHARIVVALPDNTQVVGFVTDDFSVDGSASYNTPLYTAATENANDALNRLRALPWVGGFAPNISPMAAFQSVAAWNGTNKPLFNIRMIFVATKAGEDVRNNVMKLYSTVYPAGDKVGAAEFFKAPLDYSFSGLVARNTLQIEIGKWFRARGQIMKDVNFTFSKQVVNKVAGTPLYAHGSIQFEPYRLITYGEFKGYFPGITV